MAKQRKKTRKIPAKKGVGETVSNVQAIFFTVLRDKEGYDNERLHDFWKNVNKLSEEIIEGRVTVADLKRVLREEADISI